MADPFFPQYPLYIPSKGRAEYMITSQALSRLGVHHNIVVEPQEVEQYQKAVAKFGCLTTVIPLDMEYKKKYELCDNLGLTKSTGSGPARNFIWDHSIQAGAKYHWIMDDNIRGFRRLNFNEKVKVSTPGVFRAMEDFCFRYKNVVMAGPNYCMFAPAREKKTIFTINTRIYSCNLIRNDIPFRWRGRYNEDTILSLDILKAGFCTILFNAFLQDKMTTQVLKGGNTTELYGKDFEKNGKQKYFVSGTIDKSKMLVAVHPDVSRLKFKFQRWHHVVDYSVFRQAPVRKPEFEGIAFKQNEYGMKLVTTKKAKTNG